MPINDIKIPAATAEPMTPDTFGAMACISRWFDGLYFRPSTSETRAASGTADTPALPIRGLILLPSLQNRFISFAQHTPPKVATTNDAAPRQKMMSESVVRNTSACVDAPTVRPSNIVTISISELAAVLARRFVTPLSFRRLPKNSIPRRGRADGLMKVVSSRPTIGKITFSVFPT